MAVVREKAVAASNKVEPSTFASVKTLFKTPLQYFHKCAQQYQVSGCVGALVPILITVECYDYMLMLLHVVSSNERGK